MKSSALSEFGHYVNLRTTLPKLRDCMKEFKFKPLRDMYNALRAGDLSRTNFGDQRIGARQRLLRQGKLPTTAAGEGEL